MKYPADAQKEDVEFDSIYWIKKGNDDLCLMSFDHRKPKTWVTNGQIHINTFNGYLHTERKKVFNYPKNILDLTNRVWKHVYEVWCSSNDKVYKYVKRWICHFINGEKNQTFLYLKAGQGVGKSIISDFIKNRVIGAHNCALISDPTCLLNGGFNGCLAGKLFADLEEIPAQSQRQLCNLGNAIKIYITGDTMTINQKGIDNQYPLKNLLNFMLKSNKNAIQIEHDDRRVIQLDISEKYKGNFSYFDALGEAVSNDIVGECFYWYCIEFWEKDPKFDSWKENPMTKSKIENQLQQMNSFYIFIKHRYILKDRNIDETLNDFKKMYVEDVLDDEKRLKMGKAPLYSKHMVTNITSHKLNKLLTEIGITTFRGAQNQIRLKIDAKTLMAVYQKKGWITEYDEMDYTKIEPLEDTVTTNEWILLEQMMSYWLMMMH